MELDELDPAIVYFAHHGPRQTLCREGLTNTGSTLENNILLVAEDGLSRYHRSAFRSYRLLIKEIARSYTGR